MNLNPAVEKLLVGRTWQSRPPITHWVIAVLGFSFLPPVFGQDTINRRDQARQAFLATPKGIYLHYCAHCHGDDGKGEGRLWSSELSPKPADLTALKADKETLVAMIRDGSAARGKSNLCPPWGHTISPERIERLAQYLRSLCGQPPGDRTAIAVFPTSAAERFPWLLLCVILAQCALIGWLVLKRRQNP